MTNKKMTKADYFRQIMENYALTEDEKAFVQHELDLLAKKNSAEKKPTANQLANQSIQQAIVEGLEPGKLYTVTDILKTVPACAELTNQKVSALIRGMVGTEIERVEEKRKAYFKLMEK
jgi:DNA-binding phage protein